MIGEYDKATGQLKVSPILGNKIIRMEARVRGIDYAARVDAVHHGNLDTIDVTERAAKTRQLVEAFGSQRRLKQMRADQAARVNAEHVSNGDTVMGMLATAALASPTGTREHVMATALSQRNIPPNDPSGTSAEEAYKFHDIVPASVRDSLDVEAFSNALESTSARWELAESGTFGAQYVASRLSAVAKMNGGESVERGHRLKMLALLGYMLKLYTKFRSLKTNGSFKELEAKTNIPESIMEGLLDLFYTPGDAPGKWVLSKEKSNLMLGWILVLAVRAEANAVLGADAFNDLANELKMRPGELVGRFRELGCVDVGCRLACEDGTSTRSYRISLMPPSTEPKTLSSYFPALKLGARKPGAR